VSASSTILFSHHFQEFKREQRRFALVGHGAASRLEPGSQVATVEIGEHDKSVGRGLKRAAHAADVCAARHFPDQFYLALERHEARRRVARRCAGLPFRLHLDGDRRPRRPVRARVHCAVRAGRDAGAVRVLVI